MLGFIVQHPAVSSWKMARVCQRRGLPGAAQGRMPGFATA
jgi:hypothetical protein